MQYWKNKIKLVVMNAETIEAAIALHNRIQVGEVFTINLVDFPDDTHVVPQNDLIEHSVTVSCSCIPSISRHYRTSTDLTPEPATVIHRRISEERM